MSRHALLQIIEGTRVEDKLLELSFDEVQSAAVNVADLPKIPGRIPSHPQAQKHRFPKKNELKGEFARGVLLHYFANHELLAIETMAYTLLKFPDAPEEFRVGLLRTLQDEQRHLRMYLKRMKDFGVEFGTVEPNLYLWNAMKDMASPLDFVARMSMTFEQANLDFALEYAQFFSEEMGDAETSALLRQVHADEIQHVAHGVKWFEEWKSPDLSQWHAYHRALSFPLNPRRAKSGSLYDREARSQAGLNAEYIDELYVAGGSRGRVPDLFWFNPFCETEMKSNQTLPKTLLTKQRDLAPLMVWLAQEDDVVLLPNPVSLDWKKQVRDFKGELPDLVFDETDLGWYQAFESMSPWGWDEAARARAKQLTAKTRMGASLSKEQTSRLYSKLWWKKQLKAPGGPLTRETLSRLSGKVMVKPDRGTSGRGQRVCTVEELLTENFEDPGFLVEPYYAKVADFSVQYELKENGECVEYTPRAFSVDVHGRYLGASIGTPLGNEVIQKNLKMIRGAHEPVIQILRRENYVGPFGIDGLVSDVEIIPIIEVNCRYTMGRVALELEKKLKRYRPHGQGHWRFYTRKDYEKMQLSSFAELYAELENLHGKGNVLSTTPLESEETWTVLLM